MHAAARAKTPRTKPAADPWQALPRLADLFDSQTPQPFFKGSKVSALEALALTETKLLEQTASILGVSLSRPGRSSDAKRERKHRSSSGAYRWTHPPDGDVIHREPTLGQKLLRRRGTKARSANTSRSPGE